MSHVLPIVSGKDAVRAFEKAGFAVIPRRGKGSHTVMAKDGHPGILTIPDDREIRRGTLRALIRSAGLTVEKFVELL